MTDAILSAIIAGTVSLVVSLIGYFVAWRKLKNEKSSIERGFAQEFAKQVLPHRLRLYPKAFELTSMLGKGDADDSQLVLQHQEILKNLRNWKVGEVECVISKYAEARFDDLVERLKANPERGNRYGRIQLNAIFKDRQKFRGALRRDLGLYFTSTQLNLDHDSLRGDRSPDA